MILGGRNLRLCGVVLVQTFHLINETINLENRMEAPGFELSTLSMLRLSWDWCSNQISHHSWAKIVCKMCFDSIVVEDSTRFSSQLTSSKLNTFLLYCNGKIIFRWFAFKFHNTAAIYLSILIKHYKCQLHLFKFSMNESKTKCKAFLLAKKKMLTR